MFFLRFFRTILEHTFLFQKKKETQRSWFLVVYVTVIMQWLSTFGIFAAYLWDEGVADSTDMQSKWKRALHILIGMVSVFLLWAYVYDQLIVVTASAAAVEINKSRLESCNHSYLWCVKFSWLYTLNVWLHVAMIFVATCAISVTTGFSDQLQVLQFIFLDVIYLQTYTNNIFLKITSLFDMNEMKKK
ncbi:hypothetical protein RFI_03368, partial [Reticulomyxa filosa]